VAKPEDIAGKIVGAGKASSQMEQLKAYVATLPGGAEVREYVDNNQAYADLAAGRIVAVGNSLPNIAYVATQRSETFEVVLPPFGKKVYFGYLGRKDADTAPLLDAIDAALAKMKADGRLAAIQKKWFGVEMDVPGKVTDPTI
jgi:polar amino acid transport system substrate-binding protein